MDFIIKLFRFVYGLLLFSIFRRTINLERLLLGKRVAIIGAANSAFHTGKGEYIDGFDVVIRVNKAPLLLKQGEWKEDIGTKADILFHSFYENERSGGGPLNLALYDSLNIRYLINPISEFSGYRVIFNFYKKYLLTRTVFTLPRKLFKKIKSDLGTYKPTIGFCALYAVLHTNFSELYITGFTFFRTAFGEGYRNEMREPGQVREFIKSAGLHDPELELAVFSALLHKNRKKRIVLDSSLSEIVKSAE
ncbi:MAG: glycosyltransferase family 29 protein [Flammeovirgaceae bacterium]|nr:MAG: glycosyltransferase family 29 protein [Flammeovirgaceae bacterium]